MSIIICLLVGFSQVSTLFRKALDKMAMKKSKQTDWKRPRADFRILRKVKPHLQARRMPPQPREGEVFLPCKDLFTIVRIERGRAFFDPKLLSAKVQLAVHVAKLRYSRDKRASFRQLVSSFLLFIDSIPRFARNGRVTYFLSS
jgi:hypothetical protein